MAKRRLKSLEGKWKREVEEQMQEHEWQRKEEKEKKKRERKGKEAMTKQAHRINYNPTMTKNKRVSREEKEVNLHL